MMSITGFEQLLNYRRRAEKFDTFLPKEEEIKESFVGVGFKVGGFSFLVKMNEVSEIIDLPDCTKIGGSKPWFLGLANVRGSLLPITDLQGFLFDKQPIKGRAPKVLIYKKNDIFIGLRIDDILGLRRFYEEDRVGDIEKLNEKSKSFIDDVYYQHETFWSVFNIRRLALDKEFLQIT